MKFAKELDEDLVPEWRVKYFDYKQGKKRIKAISSAIKEAHKSPRTPFARSRSATFKSPLSKPKNASNGSTKSPVSNNLPRFGNGSSSEEHDEYHPLNSPRVRDAVRHAARHTPTPAIKIPASHEGQPLRRPRAGFGSSGEAGTVFTRYGSIIGSPTSQHSQFSHISQPATLNLPEPAMEEEEEEEEDDGRQNGTVIRNPRSRFGRSRTEEHTTSTRVGTLPRMNSTNSNAFEVGKTRHPFRRNISFASRHLTRTGTLRRADSDRPLLKRLFSPNGKPAQAEQTPDVPLAALQNIDNRQDEFFAFLDEEMDKIETFYRSKEEEANHRLQDLREQLHVMRDQRLGELMRLERREEQRRHFSHHDHLQGAEELNRAQGDILENPALVKDLPHGMDLIYHPIQAARQVHFSRQPRRNNLLATPPSSAVDGHKDYTKRTRNPNIPYLTAKRKLKAAMQEFYRGLELLKSYALLNRTALRKINKKYDKAVHARPTMRYMTEKVNGAYFVQSTVLDNYITAVEDLYARYFEKGSHKIAVGKLRKKSRHAGAYTGSVFRNGVFAAAGFVLGVEGIVYATELLYNSDAVTSTNTSYLLQLYGGYLLMLTLFLIFAFDCMIFVKNKVNYAFVFEFDTRHDLDWRQLAELPCFFMLLLGLIMWLNFSRIGGDTMYIYYPVILIGLTLLIILCPLPVLYPASRKWLLISLGRLWFGPGLFPVEFRDFFLGDMFCSLTYAMGNIEVFFCLYAHFWNDPGQCNSSHSRLQGFFTALPGVWRALQCLRRYRDTKNLFPHLVNMLKYGFTILGQVSLSMYRINRVDSMRAFFITASAINSVYCSFWDLHMDWSLLDPNAKHPFLREQLAYKQTWPYYLAMILDPMLRFNWVFYIAFPVELQHSAILSFIVALTEVGRRGMWTLFRVENEHCTNVGRFRASRDVPLPYKLKKDDQETDDDSNDELLDEEQRTKKAQAQEEADQNTSNRLERVAEQVTERAGIGHKHKHKHSKDTEQGPPGSAPAATGVDLERQTSNAADTLRRRQTGDQRKDSLWRKGNMSVRERVGQILRRAHAQDFERRRPENEVQAEDSDDEEEEEEVEEVGSDVDVDDDAESLREVGSRDVQIRGGRGVSDVVEEDRNRRDQVDAETLLRRARGEGVV